MMWMIDRGVAEVRKTYPLYHDHMRKKRRVIGDSLLSGTEGSVHQTDPPLMEVC